VTAPSFGIMTPPSHTGYLELLETWRAADSIPAIEHAWLFDHLMPIGGTPDGPTMEGWTLLAALAANTQRLELGLLVTSNRFRPPALLAKMAATVDVIAGGRLVLGIGVGSRPHPPSAHREYDAHGIPFLDVPDAVAGLAEACTIIDRLWTSDEPFDFEGHHYRLTGAWCNPKPVRRPRPPFMIGGRSTPTMRIVAEHADIWNMPGGAIDDAAERSRLLDRLCGEIGRDPNEITRSMAIPVSTDDVDSTRQHVAATLAAGFSHIVLILSPPYSADIAHQTADQIIDEFV
jgi:alkanesulfonate monooxygenase SsuD/methylene tetrahydromethanopterin reductase-like flavin-dependent oxidoreductase (luciferase family)